MKNKLIALCFTWEKQAKKRFQLAESETDMQGKRLLEHGAMINYNHAQELRRALYPKFSLDFIFKVFRKNAKCP